MIAQAGGMSLPATCDRRLLDQRFCDLRLAIDSVNTSEVSDKVG